MIYLILLCFAIFLLLVVDAPVIADTDIESLKEQLKDKAMQEAEVDGEVINVETDDAIATVRVWIELIKGDNLTPDNERRSADILDFKIVT